MSAVTSEHHSASRGHVVMAFVAFVLALAAAYLWLTDGTPAQIRLPSAASFTQTRADPAPAAPATKPHRIAHLGAGAAAGQQTLRFSDAEASVEDESPPAAGPPTPQIAIDAAAAGMTARVRPADPSRPNP